MTGYISDTAPGSGARRTPRSWLRTDAPSMSLNGEWSFRLLAAAPGNARCVLPEGENVDDMASLTYDDRPWDRLPVPSHWVLEGDGRYGRPIYTNKQYPFPIDPPRVPDENPTGEYRRWFTLPSAWDGCQTVVLRFDGVESRYRVWVNGIDIGMGTGSRLGQEFDITSALSGGANLIAVRVHQWSASSYVEDQDQWWLPGIFRDVTLLSRPADGIEDVWLRTGFADGAGSIDPELSGRFPMTLQVPELGVDVTWNTPDEVRPVVIESVEPWTAETPRLYDAIVANAAETVSMRIGFRSVRIEGGRLLVNGRQLILHGMNRHEIDPDRGRVFDEAAAREDLAMMKRFNVNAIRTSHYPPHPKLLDLADELGLWVMLECDLETHGFVAESWSGNPSDDPAWRDAYLDRMQRSVERDKNHPSIVMWSLGNESGTGQNLVAMAGWVRQRDPGRPIHYEGDLTGAYTDVYSRMYLSIPELEQIGRDESRSPLLGCSVAESVRQRTKPFLLCEYGHAMGNGPGGLEQYAEMLRAHPRLHGGFIWEWRDHGIRTTDASGQSYFAYGGDFGEVVHDGNFVMDGMVLSDGTPSPGLHEFKHVEAPVRISIDPDGLAGSGSVTVTISNERHTADTADLRFVWRVETDGIEVAAGELDIPAIAAGETAPVEVSVDPVGEGESWFTVEALLMTSTPWADAGHEVTFAQRALVPARRGVVFPNSGNRAMIFATTTRTGAHGVSARFSVGLAAFVGDRLTALAGRPVLGPRLELWRAPTDNDRGASSPSNDAARTGALLDQPAVSYADQWRGAGLDRLVERVEHVETTERSLQVRRRWSAADSQTGVETLETWFLADDDLWLSVEILPDDRWDMVWPRIGLRFDIDPGIERAAWFGTGPAESYPDSRRAARVGRFDAAIDRLTVDYSRPQETGHRSEFRELTLSGNADGVLRPWLRIDAAADEGGRLPGFTLARYTAQQMDAADHPHELSPGEHHHLYIDAAQNGLGSRACGPDVWPEHLLRPQARTIRLRFRAENR